MVFALMKEGSPFIQIVHSVRKFGGDPLNPDEYQDQIRSFVGGRVQRVEPVAILVKDDAWKWSTGKAVTGIVNLAS